MRIVGLIAFVSGTLFAQNAGLTARQLYLQEDPTTSQSKEPAATKPATGAKTGTGKAPNGGASKGKASPPPAAPVAAHLGLRYNLLKFVDYKKSNEVQEIAPDSNLKTNDCVALRLKPNRGGYLYVFNLGTSGAWQPLLPSAAAPDERKNVQALTEVMIPENTCFHIDDPRGTDTLMVVMTEKQEDFLKLNDAIRKSAGGNGVLQQPSHSPASSGLEPTVIAAFRADEANRLVSRDISLARVGDEPPNSVYVVNTAATKNDRIVIEIKIRHE